MCCSSGPQLDSQRSGPSRCEAGLVGVEGIGGSPSREARIYFLFVCQCKWRRLSPLFSQANPRGFLRNIT